MPVAPKTLTLCEFNLENLFISMDYYSDQDLTQLGEPEWRDLALAQLRKKQKPLHKLWGLSKAILDIDPDILMLIEVGGEASLENFNRHFLGDRFTPHFVAGNSSRNIDLGFLVRKGLSWQTQSLSNKETPIEVRTFQQGKFTARFSRDVAELRLFDPKQKSKSPALILLLTHLKSKISSLQDVGGKDVRTAEAFALANLYQSLRTTYPDTPIVLGGDLNADLSSLELEFLRHTDLSDFHDCIGTHADDRPSLVYFDYAGNPRPQTLDYLLVSPQLKGRIAAPRSGTYRYKGLYDLPEELPKTPRERYQMPSDHYPLVLTLTL